MSCWWKVACNECESCMQLVGVTQGLRVAKSSHAQPREDAESVTPSLLPSPYEPAHCFRDVRRAARASRLARCAIGNRLQTARADGRPVANRRRPESDTDLASHQGV